ncbi:putative inactive receptor kinase [Abeliophyllum distichum]|uniref:Inactive receptor kinase n=1 Tax=Abeliophyllum distichum TaxID=126358 RepID=A0ABD1UR23_9LAMI
MSTVYDNWERLVAAVLRREELWELCHAPSRTSSTSSISSDFSSIYLIDMGSSLNFPNPRFVSNKLQSFLGIKVGKRNSGLVFIDGSGLEFRLEDLLGASLVFLGDELHSFSSSFAAILQNGITVVVKKLYIGRVARKVFDERTKILTSFKNENVVALRGYYISEDYMLVLYDYFIQGSVFSMLHRKRGDDRVQLDWETRVRIAIGTARGLAYIHTQCGGKLVHGNIKASNIFLNSEQYGCLADIVWEDLVNPTTLRTLSRNSGYHAPEFMATGKVSQACDVYSFGVLLLELLTGRSPLNRYLAHWTQINARDGLNVLVYDVQTLRNPIVKQEMCNVLEIALHCVEDKPENRPNMNRVVNMVELIVP